MNKHHKRLLWVCFFVWFSVFSNSFLKYKKFFNNRFESFVSRNIRNFLIVGFFDFSRTESYFLKCKRNIRLDRSISENIRKFRYARGLNISFLKYRKSSVMPGFWIMPFPKYKESSVSWKLGGLVFEKIYGVFKEKFWGMRPESVFCRAFHRRCLKVFWICLGF